ncbi:MAG TPA: response regulator transcription factor [Bdellovibrio sp.]|nr:response regulator transcription factor [Bdellovibrio sp.]
MNASLPTKKIVIIDDYEDTCKLLTDILQPTYQCSFTSDSNLALNLISQTKPDLILLDYKMPNLSGVDICRELKKTAETKDIPVIFISGVATIEERIMAFESGADDFISKPFHTKELILRIKARLFDRQVDGSELHANNLKINLLSRQVYIEEEEINLTPKQFEILKMLVESKNNLVTRQKCLTEIWGQSEVTSRNVDSQINYLKRKIKKFTGRIVAVPSLGYRLEAQG